MPAATATDAARFGAAFGDFLQALQRARSRAAQREGITASRLHLLTALEREPGLSVGEMAAAAGCASPTATRMLAALQRDGIVTRKPAAEDRRRMVVALTPEGKRLLAAQSAHVEAKKRELYERLTPDERAHAEELLHHLAELIEDL
jgi:DNA-binding MarR family transcriptional regulator